MAEARPDTTVGPVLPWPPPGPLSPEERVRYERQLVMPEIGEEGQARLRRGSVLVVGAGGLGSPALSYLVAAGVGRVGVVDDDVVQLSNLQRQTLYTEQDLGLAKAARAAARLAAVNPTVRLDVHAERLTAASALRLVAGYDVVVGAVDTFAARYMLNDACVAAGATLCEGAVRGFVGAAITIAGGATACYRCVFPEAPAEGPGAQASIGVLGPVPGVIGAVQALEAIKVLSGAGRPLYDRLLQFDGATMVFGEIAVRRSPECPACGPQSARRSGTVS
jgi:molybdopterin/thiamine biosynthesis adenylyltransferase